MAWNRGHIAPFLPLKTRCVVQRTADHHDHENLQACRRRGRPVRRSFACGGYSQFSPVARTLGAAIGGGIAGFGFGAAAAAATPPCYGAPYGYGYGDYYDYAPG